MGSKEAYEVFRRAVERARVTGANLPETVERDLPDFERAVTLLSLCFGEGTRETLKAPLREQALEILGGVHVREPPSQVHDVYSTMYGLFLALAEEPWATSQPAETAPFQGGAIAAREKELLREIEQLKKKFADLEQTLRGEKDAHAQSLRDALEQVHRPLLQLGDLFAHNEKGALSRNRITISLEDVFGTGKIGVELIRRFAEGIKVIAKGTREFLLSPKTKELVDQLVAGARNLVRGIAKRVKENAELWRVAQSMEEAETELSDAAPPTVDEATNYAGLEGTPKIKPIEPDMKDIPPGNFLMGSPDKEGAAYEDEKPQRPVAIDYRFAVGRYPVTFQEFDSFAEETNRPKPDDNHWGRGRRPVIDVSWDDAQAYVAWLGEETGKEYRLPTEAEWEYACRAGSDKRYSFGDGVAELGDHAWFVGNSESQTHPVGEKRPNGFGLYDMHGNVWEWMEDVWHSDYKAAPKDGSAWTKGRGKSSRVLRGGSWSNDPRHVRSADRFRGGTDDRNSYYGFRVARTLP